MPELFSVHNGVQPTTAAIVPMATGTSIKTMIQIATTASRPIRVSSWHVSFNAAALAAPIAVELVHTDVNAHGTTFASADVVNLLGTTTAASATVTLGVSASMFGADAEGTITNAVVLETFYIEQIGLGSYIQYPEGLEPYVPVSRFLRLRVTAGTSVSCYCGIKFK